MREGLSNQFSQSKETIQSEQSARGLVGWMHPTISNMASQFASVDDLYAPSAIDFLAMIFILLWILLAVFHLVSIVTG